jgi:hypothetical protein
MKRLVTIPLNSAKRLEEEGKAGPGYHIVSVRLKDGRYFDPAVASEGCIIQIKGYKDLPFTSEEVESVAVTETSWNFRRKKLDLPERMTEMTERGP